MRVVSRDALLRPATNPALPPLSQKPVPNPFLQGPLFVLACVVLVVLSLQLLSPPREYPNGHNYGGAAGSGGPFGSSGAVRNFPSPPDDKDFRAFIAEQQMLAHANNVHKVTATWTFYSQLDILQPAGHSTASWTFYSQLDIPQPAGHSTASWTFSCPPVLCSTLKPTIPVPLLPFLSHSSHSCPTPPIPVPLLPFLSHSSHSCPTPPIPVPLLPFLSHSSHSCPTPPIPVPLLPFLSHSSHSCPTPPISRPQMNLRRRLAQLKGMQPQLDMLQSQLSILVPTFPCPKEERVGVWADGRKCTASQLSVVMPTFPCPKEERVGVWADGRKWLCNMKTFLPDNPVVYSSQTLLTEAREYLPDVDHVVFKHFRIVKRVEGKAQQYECKFCSNLYTGAAIRCAQHFASWKGMKRREVVLCKDAPQDVRRAMKAHYEAKTAAADERRRAAAAAVAAVTADGGKRARITDYLEGDTAARKREADESLALAWAALHIPERHIDHPLMVNALNNVSRAGKDYVPPKRKYVGGAGLVACRNGIEAGLVGVKTSWKRTGVTVSSDMMTDRRGRPQANILLVNDSGAVFYDCVDCNMEKKTGGYVAGILRPVVEEVGPENVVAFCMDGGSNYAVAVKRLIQEWPHIQDVPCATHVMDLLLEDVGKMGWAKPVVDKGGEISSFVRNHHWTRGYLRTPELVEGKVLEALKPAGTRFGTNYISISRLCAMRGSLTNMVTSEGWKEWAVGDRKKSCDAFAALIHDAAWWKTADFFTALLKLPYKAMRQTDGHAVGMMGRIYDVMLQLTEDVGDLLDADEEQLSNADKDQIRKILRDRWDGSLACAMHVAGRILNPANQEEDIFGTDLECTKVFKAFISQYAEFLASRGDGGDDACSILLELGDGLRAFLDMKGAEPPIPAGYNGLEDEAKGEDEEESDDDILEDEYAK
ncbi:unnamed protein product [Closterium sp. NIES-64]|nr:unnamed protein product [Closterium sp. NIES-64]